MTHDPYRIFERQQKRQPGFGPVVLVYSDGPSNPMLAGRTAHVLTETVANVAQAIRRARELCEACNHHPFIMEGLQRDSLDLWTWTELRGEFAHNRHA